MPFRNIQIDISETAFQAAQNRATREGKDLGQVIGEFLARYAQGAAAGAPATYTVQRGDTLGKIARAVYGDVYKYPVIQRANNISDPSRIWVGQVLIIPPLDDSGAVSTPAIPRTTSSLVSAPPPPPSPPPGAVPPPTPPLPGEPVTPTAPAAPPQPVQRPEITWVGSPNFNQRPNPNDISGITIHATANSTLRGVVDWFNNPNAQVSAHYTIGKEGQIVQHVRDQDRAWHAGRSSWKGRSGCNDYCLGIELVNLNNGIDPYPEAQHQANVRLCAYLCQTYNISTDDIMGHFEIALPPGRKSDPRNYDLGRLKREVAALLGRQ